MEFICHTVEYSYCSWYKTRKGNGRECGLYTQSFFINIYIGTTTFCGGEWWYEGMKLRDDVIKFISQLLVWILVLLCICDLLDILINTPQ